MKWWYTKTSSESPMRSAKETKPDSKGYVLYDSVGTVFWKRQAVATELRPVVARGCVWGHILYLDWGGVFATVVVLLLSHVQLFATAGTSARQAPLFFTLSQSLLKLMSIESRLLSNHLILCHPLLLLPSVFPSIRIFSNELALFIRWPQYWSFSNSPSNEYSGWFPLGLMAWSPCSPGDSWESSSTTIWKHQFFSSHPSLWFQLSHPYMTTGKTIALSIQTFVSKAMSLLFNTLSKFVIAFLWQRIKVSIF